MSKTSWLPFAVTTGLLIGAIVVGGMTERRVPEPLAIQLDRIDSHISGWTETTQRELDPQILRVLDPTSYLARTYQKGTSQIDLFIAYYALQRAGESMHSPQHCLPGAGWEIMQRGSATITVAGKQVVINKYLIENLGTRMLMLYWSCPHFWHKTLRLKIHRMENLSHGVIAKEVHERVQGCRTAAVSCGCFDRGRGTVV